MPDEAFEESCAFGSASTSARARSQRSLPAVPAPSDWPEWAAGAVRGAPSGASASSFSARSPVWTRALLMLVILVRGGGGLERHPARRAVAPFLDARVAAGERRRPRTSSRSSTRGCSRSSTRCSARPSEQTRAALRAGGATSGGAPRRRRVLPASSGGSRAGRAACRRRSSAPGRSRSTRSSPRSSAEPPRSVLLVGDPGAGKTTLIVEALRRLERVARVPGERGRRDRRPGLHRHARGAHAGDRRPPRAPPRRVDLPELRGGALVRAAHAEPARGPRRAPSLRRVGRGGRRRRDRPAAPTSSSSGTGRVWRGSSRWSA